MASTIPNAPMLCLSAEVSTKFRGLHSAFPFIGKNSSLTLQTSAEHGILAGEAREPVSIEDKFIQRAPISPPSCHAYKLKFDQIQGLLDAPWLLCR